MEPMGETDAWTFLERGARHYNAGQWRESRRAFERAAAVQPQEAQAYLLLGRSSRHLQDAAGSAAAFGRAARLQPSAEALLEYGRALSAAGAHAAALRTLKLASAFTPGDIQNYFYAAFAAYKLTDPKSAFAASRHAVLLDPYTPALRWNYIACLDSEGRWSECVDTLRKSIAMDPGWSAAYDLLTRKHVALGEWPVAVALLERLRRFPECAEGISVVSQRLARSPQPRSRQRFPRRRPFVFDCFMFFNELDLLEIRLHELWRKVDRFFLVEATRTHSNQEKPLYYDMNKERFADFSSKIIHVVLDEYPPYRDAMQFDTHQRNQFNNVLEFCHDDDIVLMSDLDEIPRASLVGENLETPGLKVFDQANHYYFVNYRMTDDADWTWYGTRSIRARDFTMDAQATRMAIPREVIRDGGWHFSYLGGIDKIVQKLEAFAHQEFNLDVFKDRAAIAERIRHGEDLFGRGFRFETVDLDESYPEHIRANRQRFAHLIAPGT
jgi:beta-1,4-mannosyl-glycoprotein beta-1,4-N-acetylglucosaminyltransferase